jgi:GNAT superfamily N-acetyltransferase
MPWGSNYCEYVIRVATYEEVRAVQLEILRPHGALPGDTQPTDEWLHVAAEVDARIVGACSVGPARWHHPQVVALPEPHWQVRSMAVLPEFRGGVGAALLGAAVELANGSGAGSLWANARVEALNLYLRAGWQIVGPEWIKAGIGPHRWIVRRPL